MLLQCYHSCSRVPSYWFKVFLSLGFSWWGLAFWKEAWADWHRRQTIGVRAQLIVLRKLIMIWPQLFKSSAAYANQLKPLCSEDFWRCAYPAQNIFNTKTLVRWLEGADDLWYPTMRKPPQAISPTSFRRKRNTSKSLNSIGVSFLWHRFTSSKLVFFLMNQCLQTPLFDHHPICNLDL